MRSEAKIREKYDDFGIAYQGNGTPRNDQVLDVLDWVLQEDTDPDGLEPDK